MIDYQLVYSWAESDGLTGGVCVTYLLAYGVQAWSVEVVVDGEGEDHMDLY